MDDESEEVFKTLKPQPKPDRAPLRSRSVERPAEPAPLVPPSPAPAQPAPPERGKVEAPAPPPAAAAAPAPFPKSARRPAAEVARLCPLGAEARRLLDDKQLILPYLYRLMSQHLYLDAVRLLAHALPVREGVWWACRCSQGEASAALATAERWVAEPNEAHRRACGTAASAAGYGTAAAAAALSAFLSGGSIAPPDWPPAAPREGAAARAVASAVLLAALATEPHRAQERWFQFLKDGIGLLTGATSLPAGGDRP
jgi:hypothetical protein